VRRVAVAAVLATALATPAGAQAADVLPGDYTGGGSGDEPSLAFISIADDRSSYRGVLTVRADCEAYDIPVLARVALPEAQLDDSGAATVVRAITGTARGPAGERATEQGEATISLRVDAEGGASGTFRLSSAFTDVETGQEIARCDTGEQTFQARIVPARVSRRASIPPRNADLVGAVGLQPLVARVRGGDIQSITVLYRSGCQRRATGTAISRIVAVPRLDLDPRVLAFRARGFNRLFTADGEELVRFEVSGRFGRGGVMTGTIRYRGRLRDNDGDVRARCDSGTLRWRAIPAEA
jgi:hypothetical protein